MHQVFSMQTLSNNLL